MNSQQYDVLVRLICTLIGEAETYRGDSICAPETWRHRVASIIESHKSEIVEDEDE